MNEESQSSYELERQRDDALNQIFALLPILNNSRLGDVANRANVLIKQHRADYREGWDTKPHPKGGPL